MSQSISNSHVKNFLYISGRAYTYSSFTVFDLVKTYIRANIYFN